MMTSRVSSGIWWVQGESPAAGQEGDEREMSTAAPTLVSTPMPGSGAVLTAIYRLVLRHQLTKARLLLFGCIAAVYLLVSVLIATRSPFQVEDATRFVSVLGLGLVVPIVSLVLGSAALGEWVDDETLVYVWLRPVRRLWIAVAATLAALTVAVPVSVIPLTGAAAIASGGTGDVIVGTFVATLWASVAYTALFVTLGLVIRRALLWGLVYVFIWEFFVARSGAGAARLSINTYAASLLSHFTDVELPLADRAQWTSYLVPVVVAAAAIALTTWRLNRADVA